MHYVEIGMGVVLIVVGVMLFLGTLAIGPFWFVCQFGL